MYKYEFTKELVTGNSIIDGQHKRLIEATNELMMACSVGKGRDSIKKTSSFLNNYVNEHFSDEEKLQSDYKYPDIAKHKIFHAEYKKKLANTLIEIEKEGATINTLSRLNTDIGVLISHIRSEDRRVAAHISSL